MTLSSKIRLIVLYPALIAAHPAAAMAQTSPANAACPKPTGVGQAGQVHAVIIALPASANGAAKPQSQNSASGSQQTTPPPSSAPMRHER